MAETTFRYVGSAAQEFTVNGKSVMVGFGDTVTLSDEDAKELNAAEAISTKKLLRMKPVKAVTNA